MAAVRRSVPGDVGALKDRLRPADKLELRGHDAEEALHAGLVGSREPYTIEHEGHPIGMFGVTPATDNHLVGYVWLLGSKEISDIRWEFLRHSKTWLNRIAQPFDMVCNTVHAENTLHHRWLKYLEFRFIRHVPDYPFLEFAKLNHDVLAHPPRRRS